MEKNPTTDRASQPQQLNAKSTLPEHNLLRFGYEEGNRTNT